MSGVSSVVIKIGAETASAVGAIKNVDKALGQTQTTGQKMQAGLQKAALPAAAALTALAGAAVVAAKAAAEDQKSRQQLDSQLQRSLGSTKAVTDANEEWIASMSDAVAISREELRPALAGAVRATGDLAKAHQMLTSAADVSAATGKPLASVVAALGKAYNGSTGALKKLAPSISDAALQSGNYSKIQQQLNAQFAGAAKGQADTAAGQYKRMQLAMQELQVTIGTALLPILQELIPVVTQVVQVFAGHPGAILAAAGAVGAFSAAILIANAALKAYTTIQEIYALRTKVVAAVTRAWSIAQWLLNAAMDANPIGLAIVAVAALTAGIIIAYRHSSTFRGIVQAAFSTAKSAIGALMGPLGAVIGAFKTLYEKSAGVRSAVVGAMNAIFDAIKRVIDLVSQLIDAISHIHVPHINLPGPLAVPGASMAPMAAGTTGPVVMVNISGAIDPESTALAIRRVLTRYDRRRGRTPLGGAGA